MESEDTIALVSGAGSGIGLACAQVLLHRGDRVVLNDLDADRLEQAEQTLAANVPDAASRMIAVKADVTDTNDVAHMFDSVADRWGPVSILINNAGISGGRLQVSEIVPELWDRMMTANVRGMYLCTRQALPAMCQRRWGRIVNLASVAAVSARRMSSAHYAASKGAITAFTRRIAADVAPHQVAVNCVAPGLTEGTRFTENVTGPLLEQYCQRIPAGRAGRCEEVAELVAFLCSKHAGYLIGQTIVIDGGASA